ncbi:PAS domain-containing protein [Amycolatopsis sp. CA-126428]|uniref:PAS domain-containing protein n=1 Tax=Amycolatopsis sp. CA-126428 TaxID=2073158 RepID=UPI003F8D623D
MFLGKAGMLLSHSRIFEPLDLKRRVFRKVAGYNHFATAGPPGRTPIDVSGLDELQNINEELRDRSVELNELNDFLESVLTSIQAGIVVIDTEMRIRACNRGAEDLWGVRREEAEGTHLLNLDIGLPLTELRPAVRDAGFQAGLTLKAINRRGRPAVVRLLCGALRSAGGRSQGALLLMEGTRPAGIAVTRRRGSLRPWTPDLDPARTAGERDRTP